MSRAKPTSNARIITRAEVERPLPRSAVLAVIAATAIATLTLFIAPSVVAQEGNQGYVSTTQGELAFSATGLVPAAEVTVSGSGFVPDGAVQFIVANFDSGTAIISEELFADADGIVSHSFFLPDEMVTGEYVARISGLATDGAELSLEKRVMIEGNLNAPTTTTGAAPATTAVPATDTAAVPAATTAPAAAGSPDTSQAQTPASDAPAARFTSDATPADSAPSVTQGPLPTVDPPARNDDSDSGSLSASGRDDVVGSTTSSSSGSSTVIWIVLVAVFGSMGAGALLIRRRSAGAH